MSADGKGKSKKILAIESSCDETAAAVVTDSYAILSDVVASQDEVHAKYGGVVPELASRRHVEKIGLVVDEALERAGCSAAELDAVAATQGPGLIGSLLVGFSYAKGLAYKYQKPFIGVNHLEGHIASARLERPDLREPYLALLVSGGHTELIHVKSPGVYEVLGRTLDDAVGEAYDKVAKIMNLGYPGGPRIDALAKEGNPKYVHFPRVMLKNQSLDFSLSGLKTAVLYHLRDNPEAPPKDVAASFQQAVVEVLARKTVMAVKKCRLETVIVSGGVAANSGIRERLKHECEKRGWTLVVPRLRHCTDNAVMIGAAAVAKLPGQSVPLGANAYANYDLGRN